MDNHNQPTAQEFAAIRLKLASPEDIHEWSYGEVTRPETINYRTQKPEKDGLFDERIFGPTKDWECYCGKYKRIRYKGIVCDKCGVEVTRAFVRRERMGHIDLSAPVTHIWFLRGVPSKIGLLLDLSVQNLEKVVYFANFIVTNVDEELRDETLAQIDEEATAKKKQLKAESKGELKAVEKARDEALTAAESKADKKKIEKEAAEKIEQLEELADQKQQDLKDAVDSAKKELKDLEPMTILSEVDYQDLSLKYGHVFDAGIGAEAIRYLLEKIDLDKLITILEDAVSNASKNQKRRHVRRLKLVKNLKKNNIRPEWMVLTTIPVIPPDLRPMVPLDGGRYAASDLNDLYRRVINRNNRLKRLKDLNAPEVIQRNEKRMLQEACDALIDNSKRHGKTVTASTGQRRQLKSMADMLKGKQGRFRQNLLGKRVDYSGRSVIVVGPNLKIYQCGIPKKMALELFKPFVIAQLIERELVFNVRSANRFIESNRPEVWDILEEVTEQSHVLLNRAPTLHRLGIQAFQPVLIEGKAIQVHPMVCSAFNADFDGDQMAVHVPLTEGAKAEAAELMLSSKNLLKPATGDPVVTPTQDLVLGSYWMTQMNEPEEGATIRAFADSEEAQLAWGNASIHIQEKIKVVLDGELIETCVGRLMFNEIIPDELGYQNHQFDKKGLKKLIAQLLKEQGGDVTVQFLDDLKTLSIKFLTMSGLSWGISDTPVPAKKKEIIKAAEAKVNEVEGQFAMGLLTDEERHAKVIEIWMDVKEDITKAAQDRLDKTGPVYAMIESGARGSWGQTTQMMGWKGPVVNPAGETMELPVKASFKEGLDVLEYFISTHGARKGLTDTALKTANAGYLTRRLVDVAQDVIVAEEDCGTKSYLTLNADESDQFGETFGKRLWGRYIADTVKDEKGNVIAKRNDLITEEVVEAIEKANVKQVAVRTALNCETKRGICQKCYGVDLGNNDLVNMGTAVGIIAAQSIGEPGTQLTMRTFHTGGVAGADITQGLPRVEELFEARPIKKPAVLSDVDGQVEDILSEDKLKTIRIRHIEQVKELYPIKKRSKLMVKDGENVRKGAVLLEEGKGPVKSKNAGNVKLTDKSVIVYSEMEKMKDFPLPFGYAAKVTVGDLVTKGQRLCEGSLDLQELLYLRGKEAVQKYIINEIKYIYSSQGQPLNEKHVEVIVRQMFQRAQIRDPRDTDLVEGDIVSLTHIEEANEAAEDAKGKGALVDPVLLGLTKASLSTDSFLSAASFQQTSQVLIDAAVSGKVDYLRGLKENVIIGKLIPVGTGFREREAEMARIDEIAQAAAAADKEAKDAADVKAEEKEEEVAETKA